MIDTEVVTNLLGNDNKNEFKKILMLDTLIFTSLNNDKDYDNLYLHK